MPKVTQVGTSRTSLHTTTQISHYHTLSGESISIEHMLKGRCQYSPVDENLSQLILAHRGGIEWGCCQNPIDPVGPKQYTHIANIKRKKHGIKCTNKKIHGRRSSCYYVILFPCNKIHGSRILHAMLFQQQGHKSLFFVPPYYSFTAQKLIYYIHL